MTVEVRCPTDDKLLGVADGFVGCLSWRCPRCKVDVSIGAEPPSDVRVTCQCGRWLATGVVLAGRVIVQCRTCRTMTAITDDGRGHPIERPRPAREERPARPPIQPPTQDEIVARIEERWQLLRLDKARRSVELAVGLRFDVFNRDGFRCRYCGRGPAQGVFLEADHVIPCSAGGPDALDNLVTACWDCNHGKAAKLLTA